MAELKLTKGGLAPATLTNLDTNEVVNFMFNPFEYTLSKSNTWQDKPVTGQNVPYINFQQGGAIKLKLILHFDSQATGADVRTFTDKLWKMVLINESKVDAKTGKGQPPPVVFDWGKLHFKAIITSLSQHFTLFTETGIPLRCTVDVDLQQYLDEPGETGTAQAGGTSPAKAPTTAVQGQRLDNMTKNPNDQRKVAEKNNINNPLKVPNGTKLKMD
jgi:contractile injection system tube protein